ncbi:MAG: FG-GAP-like repeat-containing protein [Bacteroidales bacterium]|nr:FG-GAP-like repeat-containing protein [Bacteroidales bacterium]
MKTKPEKFLMQTFVILSLFLLAIPSVYAQDPPNKNEVLSLIGFPMGAPNEWEDPTNSNPYGEGVKNINPFHELAFASTNRYHMSVRDAKKSSGALTEKSLLSSEFSVSGGWSGSYGFTNGLERIWAGDFTGSGKIDVAARVLIASDFGHHLYFSQQGRLMSSPAIFPTLNVSDLPAWSSNAVVSAAVGDFNGDGKDEVAVYVPGGNYSPNTIRIYSYDAIGNAAVLEHTITLPVEFNNANLNNHKRNYLTVQMCAGDLNRDGKADLVVVASFNRNSTIISDNISNHYSRMLIYHAGDNCEMTLQQVRSLRFRNDGDAMTYHLRDANVTLGDLNGDGRKEDIIVAGHFSKNDSWNVVKNDVGHDAHHAPKMAITCFNRDGSLGKGQLTGGILINAFDIHDGKEGGGRLLVCVGDDETVYSPVAITSFKEKGSGYPEAVFADGQVYRFSNAFNPVENANDAILGSAHHTGYWHTWYAQAVAGNFTQDPTGKEGVIYVHSTRDNGTGFSVGSILLTNELDDLWASQYTHNLIKTSTADEQDLVNLSIAAVDYDNDGMLLRYKGEKDYYFTDPKVVAILQAAPHFAELDAFNDSYSSNGSTSISRFVGEGTSTNQSVSITGSVIVGFEYEFSVMGVANVAGINIELKMFGSMGYEYQSSSERTTNISVNSPSDVDRVIVTMIPYTRYRYDMFLPQSKLMSLSEYNSYKSRFALLEYRLMYEIDPEDTEYEEYASEYYSIFRIIDNMDKLRAQGYNYGDIIPSGWQEHVVSVPAAPRTMTITVDQYDAIAQEFGLEKIRGKVLTTYTEVGKPASYRSNPVSGADLPGQGWQTVAASGLSTRTLEIANTETTSHGITWGAGFELTIVAKAGGFKTGGSAGIEYEGGYAWTNTSGNSFGGTVSDLPLGTSGYFFDWDFMIYNTSINNEPCIALEYLVRNVVQPPPTFYPVTDIKNVPTAAIANVPRTLTATVVPIYATNSAIIWSVRDAGTTNASIALGNILNTTKAGTVILTATIIDGIDDGIDFTKDFLITVAGNAQVPTITEQPAGAIVTVGPTGATHNLTVAATVTDDGALSYQWYSNSSPLATGGTPIDGATTTTFPAPVDALGTFYYYVVVTNEIDEIGYGGSKTATITSAVATIAVVPIVDAETPVIITDPQSTMAVTGSLGATKNLTVAAEVSDDGTLSYQWYSNTSLSNSGGTPIGTNSPTFAAPIDAAGTFYYYVEVTNTIADNGDGGIKTITITSDAADLTVKDGTIIDLSDLTPPAAGAGWTFSGTTYVILDGASVIVIGNNTSTGHHIDIAANATALVKLIDVTITNLPENIAPIDMQSGSTAYITLEGTNTLQGGVGSAGIQTHATATLIITEESSGTLTATGGGSTVFGFIMHTAAGIGGGFDNSSGAIIINGGVIEATGYGNSAGIGGSRFGNGGNVTINGGMVTATGGSNAVGIGAGAGSSNHGTLAMNGNVVVFTSSVGDKTAKTKGILFDGNDGTVYGNVTLENNVNIPAGKILTVMNLTSLTIPDAITLTNNGKVTPAVGSAVTVAGTVIVNKIDGASVNVPTENDITFNSVTLKATTLKAETGQNVEYAYNTVNAYPMAGWQDDLTFSGLAPLTQYYFFARSKANTYFYAGAASSGYAIKTAAAVIVNAQSPTITTHPAGATVTIAPAGTTHDLTVAAIVTDGGTLSYQWYSNTTPSNSDGTLITGANAATFPAPIDALGTRYYYVIVTNEIADNLDGGNKIENATSNVAALTVVKRTYTITAATDANGTISPSGNVVVIEDEDQLFSFTPNTCYEIDQLWVGGVVTAPDSIVSGVGYFTIENVICDSTIYATFTSKTYTVTLPAVTGATIAPEGGSSSPINCGNNYSFTVTLDAAYNQSTITVQANGITLTPTSGVYTITDVMENQIVTVEGVQINTYTVTLPAVPGATIAPTGGSSSPVIYDSNYSFILILEAAFNQSTVIVKANGITLTPTLNVYTITNITENQIVTVEGVQINTYTVTLPAVSGATIAPTGGSSSPVMHGSNYSFDITLEAGYSQSTIIVKTNGTLLIPTSGVYTISNITENQVVTMEDLFYAALVSDNSNYCGGGSVTLTANVTPTAAYTYDWYLDNVFVASGSSNTYTSSGLLPRIAPYNYQVVVRSALGGEALENIAITVNALPTVAITTNYTDICAGGSITATANVMPTDNYDYVWYLDGNVTGFNQTLTLNNLSVGAHELYVEVTPVMLYNGCDVTSAPTTLTVHNNPVVTIAAAETATCAGETAALYTDNIQIDAEVDGNYTYQWALNGIDIPNALMSSYSRTLDNAGSYQFTMRIVVNNGLGCASDWSNPITIAVEAAPQVSLSVNNNTYCEGGGEALLTAAVLPAGNYTYDWYLDDVLVVSNNSNTFISTGLSSQPSPYNYHVVVRSALGCEGVSNSVGITIKALPTVSVTVNHTDICPGGSIIAAANVSPTDNYDYVWYLNGVASGYTQQFSMNNLSVGPHSLYVKVAPVLDYNACEVNSLPITLTVHNNPVVTIAAAETALCAGETASVYVDNVFIDSEVSGNYAYQWALNGVDIPNAIMSSYSRMLDNAGSYEFTMRLTVNNGLGCASDWSAPVVVTVNELPKVILVSDNSSYCEGGSALLSANVTPADNYDYDWYLDNVAVVSNNSNHFISTGLTPNTTPYNYQVVVRSASGCEGVSNVLGLTVVAVPTVSITTDYTEICREGSIIATASIMSAGNYEHFICQWAVNGATINNASQSIYTQTLEAGIYVFTARMIQNDGLGCVSDWSNPVTVTVKDIEVPAFFTTDCGEENTGSYRTVHVPIDVRFGNPQSYAISFVDVAHASFNRSGLVVHNAPSGAYIEARLPLRAGDYEMIIDIDGCLYTAIGRVLVDAFAMGGANLIEQRWNDVLTVNNNTSTNGGFTFYSYQWYKNGVLIPGATKQNYTEPDGRLNGQYHVELLGYAILATNQTAPVSYVSCPFTPSPQFSMRVYPVPVGRNQPLTFETSLTAAELAGARIEIYDMAGSLQRSISNLSPTMTISGFNNTGIYIGRIITRNNEVTTIQFLVQ